LKIFPFRRREPFAEGVGLVGLDEGRLGEKHPLPVPPLKERDRAGVHTPSSRVSTSCQYADGSTLVAPHTCAASASTK
jgi:hypothetical protein